MYPKGAPTYIKQTFPDLKGEEKYSNTIGNLYTPLSSRDYPNKKPVRNITLTQHISVKGHNTYQTSHPKAAECTFF